MQQATTIHDLIKKGKYSLALAGLEEISVSESQWPVTENGLLLSLARNELTSNQKEERKKFLAAFRKRFPSSFLRVVAHHGKTGPEFCAAELRDWELVTTCIRIKDELKMYGTCMSSATDENLIILELNNVLFIYLNSSDCTAVDENDELITMLLQIDNFRVVVRKKEDSVIHRLIPKLAATSKAMELFRKILARVVAPEVLLTPNAQGKTAFDVAIDKARQTRDWGAVEAMIACVGVADPRVYPVSHAMVFLREQVYPAYLVSLPSPPVFTLENEAKAENWTTVLQLITEKGFIPAPVAATVTVAALQKDQNEVVQRLFKNISGHDFVKVALKILSRDNNSCSQLKLLNLMHKQILPSCSAYPWLTTVAPYPQLTAVVDKYFDKHPKMSVNEQQLDKATLLILAQQNPGLLHFLWQRMAEQHQLSHLLQPRTWPEQMTSGLNLLKAAGEALQELLQQQAAAQSVLALTGLTPWRVDRIASDANGDTVFHQLAFYSEETQAIAILQGLLQRTSLETAWFAQRNRESETPFEAALCKGKFELAREMALAHVTSLVTPEAHTHWLGIYNANFKNLPKSIAKEAPSNFAITESATAPLYPQESGPSAPIIDGLTISQLLAASNWPALLTVAQRLRENPWASQDFSDDAEVNACVQEWVEVLKYCLSAKFLRQSISIVKERKRRSKYILSVNF